MKKFQKATVFMIAFLCMMIFTACKHEEEEEAANQNTVPATSDTNYVVDIKANGNNGIYLSNKGMVYYAMLNFSGVGTTAIHGRVKGLSHIKKIALAVEGTGVGNYEGMALDSNGNIYVWNLVYQTGADSAVLSPMMTYFTSGQLVDIAAAGYNSAAYYALDHNGYVYGWGDNSKYQMGNGSTVDVPVPTIISIPASNIPINRLAAGRSQAVAVTSTGLPFHWGTICFQLSEVYTTPQPVAGLSGVGAIDAGDNYNLAKKSTTGEVYIWGHVTDGYIPSLLNPIAMSAGAETYFSPMFVLSDGTLVKCGFDMGTGNVTAPESVTELSGYRFRLLAVSNRAFYVTSNGEILIQLSTGTAPLVINQPFTE